MKKAWEENATLKDPVKEKGQSLKKILYENHIIAIKEH
jgi:hypothetical protein